MSVAAHILLSSSATFTATFTRSTAMKHVGQVALATAVVVGLISFSVTVAAQGQKKAKAGASASSHNMTGCLQKGDTANTFKLTNVEGSGPKTVEIDGMATGVNLSPHVGHKVTITGTVVGAKAAAKTGATTEAKPSGH